MTKRIELAVLGAVAFLAAGTVAAEEPWKYVGGEAAWALAPSTVPAPASMAAWRAAQSANDVGADGWRLVGGEAGWVLAQHEYVLEGGKLVHAHQAWCLALHDASTLSQSAPAVRDLQPNLYKGA